MKFYHMVDPLFAEDVGLNPEEPVIITSIHEFHLLCTVVQNHVSAIIPQAAILQDPEDEPEAKAGDGVVSLDPYRVPSLPSEMPVSGMHQGIEGSSSPHGEIRSFAV